MKSKIDLSYIDSLEQLKSEQLALQARIRIQESELKQHFQRMPKEALKFGVAAIVPNVLESKASSSFFSATTNIMKSVFAKKGDKSDVLWKGVRQVGFYFLIKQALKIFVKKI